MSDVIELRRGDARAVVGARGAGLRRFAIGDWDVIWGYDGRPVAGQGDVLMPFPSRLAHGRYAFEGQAHQLTPNDAESPHAIHGFVRDLPWRTTARGRDRASFGLNLAADQIAGYPFGLEIEVSYALRDDALVTEFSVTNVGPKAAPFGAGFHPYFTLDDGPIDQWELTLPAAGALAFDGFLPTGEITDVTGTPLDFRAPRVIGSGRVTGCYARLARESDGRAVARLRRPTDGREITLRLDEGFDYLVVYGGEALPRARQVLAIEPLTCATDAFNRPEWGLRVIAPGARLTGRYEIEARR